MVGWEIEAKIHNQTSLAKRNFLSLKLKDVFDMDYPFEDRVSSSV